MDEKILLTGWGYPPDIDGGLDIHVKELFTELESRGLEVTLFLPEEKAPDRENIVGIETGDGDMIQKARQMSSEIVQKARNFDIIHTHDWFGAEVGFKARKYSDTDWISTLHSLNSSRSRKSSSKIERLEKIAVSKPDRLISVSDKLAEEINSEYGETAEVIHNGFSEASGSGTDVKKELGISGDMIFFVGRHAEQKGIEHLLYGFKKFCESSEASLVIGGEGHLTESLKEFAELLDIRDKVFFTGFISDRELGDYYRSADVFVSPSINEPFGLTITEALEAGTPVVATDNGVNELVEDGLIVKIRPDSDSICEGIIRGLEKDLDSFESKRAWSDMCDEVIKVYRSL